MLTEPGATDVNSRFHSERVVSEMSISRRLPHPYGSFRWTTPRIPPTTRPSAPTIKMIKLFPETRESSQPTTTPTMIPVTVNLKMFFGMLCHPARRQAYGRVFIIDYALSVNTVLMLPTGVSTQWQKSRLNNYSAPKCVLSSIL